MGIQEKLKRISGLEEEDVVENGEKIDREKVRYTLSYIEPGKMTSGSAWLFLFFC